MKRNPVTLEVTDHDACKVYTRTFSDKAAATAWLETFGFTRCPSGLWVRYMGCRLAFSARSV